MALKYQRQISISSREYHLSLIQKVIKYKWHPTPVLLPGKIPWTEEPGRLQSMGSPESDTTERFHFHFSLSRIGEGNGNPLQCSCLENPRDEGAWWAAVYGVARSRTRLKWLSKYIPKTICNSSEILKNFKW